MDICSSDALEVHPRFLGMGPEPLEEAFTADHLALAFRGRRQGPKTLLLDQRTVAGLGNIYVCEALHRARVSPTRPAEEIGRRKLVDLVRCIRSVLDEALVAGGSTLKDFAGADGALGYFQHSFEAYGRQGESCLRRGCRGVIERLVQAGRSTFYCPICQK
jgi:formamidopyrimidine-DNA glycosylase